jgi:glucuronate isomerase
MKVEVVYTSDNPADSLEYHPQIANGDFHMMELLTFRLDGLFLFVAEFFSSYLKKRKLM